MFVSLTSVFGVRCLCARSSESLVQVILGERRWGKGGVRVFESVYMYKIHVHVFLL